MHRHRILIILLASFFSMGQSSLAPPPEETPYDAELRCAKNKVLHANEFDDIKIDLRDGSTVSFGKKVKYLYASDVSVPAATHKGVTEAINRRTKNTQKFLVGREKDGRGKWTALMYEGEPFYHDEPSDTWYQTESAIMRRDDYLNSMKLSFWERLFNRDVYAKTYYYSDGNGDGDTNKYVLNTCDWDTLHDATTGSVDKTGDQAQIGRYNEYIVYFLGRGHFPIATFGLPDSCTITSAIFMLCGSELNPGSLYRLYTTTQSDPTNLAGGDYLYTKFTTQIANDADPVAYPPANTCTSYGQCGSLFNCLCWTLDTTNCGAGYSCINKTGWTKLGVREYDYDVTDTNGCAVQRMFAGRTSEQTGLSNDPLLIVNYTGGERIIRTMH